MSQHYRRRRAASTWTGLSRGCRQPLKRTLGGIRVEFSGDLRDYLTEHFSALRDFYTAAVDRSLAIVIWCG